MLKFNVTTIYRILHVSYLVLKGGSHLRPYLKGKKRRKKEIQKIQKIQKYERKDGEKSTFIEHSLL